MIYNRFSFDDKTGEFYTYDGSGIKVYLTPVEVVEIVNSLRESAVALRLTGEALSRSASWCVLRSGRHSSVEVGCLNDQEAFNDVAEEFERTRSDFAHRVVQPRGEKRRAALKEARERAKSAG